VMHGSRSALFCVTLFLVVLGAVTLTGWCVDALDHSIYTDLLRKYVKNGVVDYQGFKNEEAKLNQYLKVLEQVDTAKLPQTEQLAFYINAYNAWTIKLILGGYPGIKSIKDLGSAFSTPWKKPICRLDGLTISLDDLEHKIIRARFHDSRVHFAINCASKSCPPLISEPYLGNKLDGQLDASARAFINNPGNNRLEGNVLHASRIFEWYRDDFTGGTSAFFLKYAEGDLKKRLEAGKDHVKIEYLDYDWSLNGR
jgi:hypothetical protein